MVWAGGDIKDHPVPPLTIVRATFHNLRLLQALSNSEPLRPGWIRQPYTFPKPQNSLTELPCAASPCRLQQKSPLEQISQSHLPDWVAWLGLAHLTMSISHGDYTPHTPSSDTSPNPSSLSWEVLFPSKHLEIPLAASCVCCTPPGSVCEFS